jgi:hypothetical protein
MVAGNRNPLHPPGTEPITRVAVSPSLSARPNSPALANRSAGALEMALATARSTPSGTVSRTDRRGRGVSVNRRVIITCTVGPEKGSSPASISHSTQASEY